jgi:hypothetical protein
LVWSGLSRRRRSRSRQALASQFLLPPMLVRSAAAAAAAPIEGRGRGRDVEVR